MLISMYGIYTCYQGQPLNFCAEVPDENDVQLNGFPHNGDDTLAS